MSEGLGGGRREGLSDSGLSSVRWRLGVCSVVAVTEGMPVEWPGGPWGSVRCFAKSSTVVASWATAARVSVAGVPLPVVTCDFVRSRSSGCLFTMSKDGVFGGSSRVATVSSYYNTISGSRQDK
jgi:hypothetical protein